MKTFLLAAAAVSALSATQANATDITITNWSIGANLIGSVSAAAQNVSYGSVYVSQFRYTGFVTGVPGNVFDEMTNCVDLEHHVGTGAYTLPSFATRLSDVTKLRQMLTFIGNTTALVNAATGDDKNIKAAAMQLGIWEILYEGGSTGYNVASGNFSSSNGWNAAAFGTAQATANSWLADTTSGAWSPVRGKTLGYLYSPTQQSQVYLRNLERGESSLVGSVPEPGQWALMLAGFGFAGFVARRRKTNTTVAFVTA